MVTGERPISLQASTDEVMKMLGALAWGVVLGSAGVLLHDAYLPYGLLVVLLGTATGVWLVGRMWGLRRYKVVSALAWSAVVLRAGIPGTGSELLVQGNLAGNALVVGGSVIVFLAVIARS